MNSEMLFKLALGLSAPWSVTKVEFQGESSKELHLHIGFERGSKFVDESGNLCPVHDTQQRSWRHLNFFEHECYLHCKVPRIRTLEGKVKQVAVPWARPGSGFTLLFEALAMSLIESEMPLNKVGDHLGEYPNRIWTIFNYWISIAYADQDVREVTSLGIDETSSKKGHNYVTIGVDMDERRVVHATPGKGADTVRELRKHLESKQCPAEQIAQVCIDLSPAFISGVTKEFEQAAITFDRFHVKQLLNKAMDEVRKQQAREHTILKGHKYTFLKSDSKLSQQKKHERAQLIELLPILGEAYRLKVLFDDFWEMETPEEAESFLAFWCDIADEKGIKPFAKFARTIHAHWTGIANYITSRISNGILEGINSKIQLAKRRARGYANIDNYINMIYFMAAKLEFNYPHRST